MRQKLTKPIVIHYTHKCVCGRETEVRHLYSPGDNFPALPGYHKCNQCNSYFLMTFPPIGTIYHMKIDGLNIFGNEYLVNFELRRKIYEQFSQRESEIRSYLFGLIKLNNFSKNEKAEFQLFRTNLKYFKDRKENSMITSEERQYLYQLNPEGILKDWFAIFKEKV